LKFGIGFVNLRPQISNLKFFDPVAQPDRAVRVRRTDHWFEFGQLTM
jgi:hypothetical protein